MIASLKVRHHVIAALEGFEQYIVVVIVDTPSSWAHQSKKKGLTNALTSGTSWFRPLNRSADVKQNARPL
jgi:hypothetical protein